MASGTEAREHYSDGARFLRVKKVIDDVYNIHLAAAKKINFAAEGSAMDFHVHKAGHSRATDMLDNLSREHNTFRKACDVIYTIYAETAEETGNFDNIFLLYLAFSLVDEKHEENIYSLIPYDDVYGIDLVPFPLLIIGYKSFVKKHLGYGMRFNSATKTYYGWVYPISGC